MDVDEVVDHILEHHGVKGQKWGVRKDNATTGSGTNSTTTKATATRSNTVTGSNLFPKEQSASMNTIAKKMNQAYGFKVDEFVPLTARENKQGYLAYVQGRSKGGNVIHVTDNPKLKADLIDLQNQGWFVKSNPKNAIEANLTHEACHGMFHRVDTTDKGLIGGLTAKQPIAHMRDSAWSKARETGIATGEIKTGKGLRKLTTPSPDFQMSKQLSKYAHSSLFLEENEAELFTSYHWNPNPPKFVDAYMNDIHRQMGKEVQPFSGRKAHAT
jgi:hypothetical protein